MPRFFFNVYDDLVAIDEDGLELEDESAAHAEALRGAHELMCDEMRQGRLSLRHRIEVLDEHRRPVLTVPFGAAVQIRR